MYNFTPKQITRQFIPIFLAYHWQWTYSVITWNWRVTMFGLERCAVFESLGYHCTMALLDEVTTTLGMPRAWLRTWQAFVW